MSSASDLYENLLELRSRVHSQKELVEDIRESLDDARDVLAQLQIRRVEDNDWLRESRNKVEELEREFAAAVATQRSFEAQVVRAEAEVSTQTGSVPASYATISTAPPGSYVSEGPLVDAVSDAKVVVDRLSGTSYGPSSLMMTNAKAAYEHMMESISYFFGAGASDLTASASGNVVTVNFIRDTSATPPVLDTGTTTFTFTTNYKASEFAVALNALYTAPITATNLSRLAADLAGSSPPTVAEIEQLREALPTLLAYIEFVVSVKDKATVSPPDDTSVFASASTFREVIRQNHDFLDIAPVPAPGTTNPADDFLINSASLALLSPVPLALIDQAIATRQALIDAETNSVIRTEIREGTDTTVLVLFYEFSHGGTPPGGNFGNLQGLSLNDLHVARGVSVQELAEAQVVLRIAEERLDDGRQNLSELRGEAEVARDRSTFAEVRYNTFRSAITEMEEAVIEAAGSLAARQAFVDVLVDQYDTASSKLDEYQKEYADSEEIFEEALRDSKRDIARFLREYRHVLEKLLSDDETLNVASELNQLELVLADLPDAVGVMALTRLRNASLLSTDEARRTSASLIQSEISGNAESFFGLDSLENNGFSESDVSDLVSAYSAEKTPSFPTPSVTTPGDSHSSGPTTKATVAPRLPVRRSSSSGMFDVGTLLAVLIAIIVIVVIALAIKWSRRAH